MGTLTINLDSISEGNWWDNIGRDEGRDLIESALKKADDNSEQVRREGTAEVYTWLMTSVWGPSCKQFGTKPRVAFFTQLLRYCPNLVQLSRLNRRVILNLAGHAIDFRGIVGVSTFLPVAREWLADFIAGTKSLYDITAHDLVAADGDGLYHRDSAGIVANAMVNMLIVDKCLNGKPPHDHDVHYFKVEGLTTDDFVQIRRGFYGHLRQFLGPLRIKKDETLIYRSIHDKAEVGGIPRLMSPQTGKGMFDGTLPKLGFENYGKNKDGDTLFICDMNIAKPSRGLLRVASAIRDLAAKPSKST